MFFEDKNSHKKTPKTSPSKKAIEDAKKLGINLGKSWNAYSKEVRIHIYVKNMEEMVRFYNKILEFPVVKYWRYPDGEGTIIDIGGNVIELFSKSSRNYSNKSYHGNISLSLRVKDVFKLHEKFSSKNISIGEVNQNDWNDASFELLDIEGNRIIFFSPTVSNEKYYKVKG